MFDKDIEWNATRAGPALAAAIAALVSATSIAAGDDSRGPPGAAPGMFEDRALHQAADDRVSDNI